MGKLIKNHWARLIVLTASVYQLGASLEGFFWPKVFWDFLTTNLDGAVRPVPILQIVNLLCALFGIALEWPLPIFITASTACSLHANRSPTTPSAKKFTSSKAHDKSVYHGHTTSTIVTTCSADDSPSPVMSVLASLHGSIEARLLIYPFSALAALLLYQGTNAGLYYLIGMGVYFWAFSEGEMVMGVPWTLPRRGSRKSRAAAASKV